MTGQDISIANNKVLVTGGTGFLGAYIIKELIDKGYRVKALRRSRQSPFFIPASVMDKVEWVKGDILDTISLSEAVEDIDTIIHAAAKVSFHAKERKWMYKTNIDGTANVVNISLEKKIKKLVYVSSISALGRSGNGDTINEGKQWQETKLATHYAITKYHAEMEVWRGIAEGLNAVIINPSTIIGYGDWDTTSCAIFKSTYNEFPWYTNGVNGFVDVRDAARAAILLMESDIKSERFIISGENWSFRDLINSMADGFSKKQPQKEASPFLGALAWRAEKIKSIFTGGKPLLTKESARLAQSHNYFDNSKIKKYLPGFTFTPLQQTIQQACKDYLQHVQSI